MVPAKRKSASPRKAQLRPHGVPDTWDYRLVRQHTKGSEPFLEICEVYFDSRGVACAWCTATAQGDNLRVLRRDLKWLGEALSKPVIDETEIDPSEWKSELKLILKEEGVPLEEAPKQLRRKRGNRR